MLVDEEEVSPSDDEDTPEGSDVTQNFNAPVENVAGRDINIIDGVDPKDHAKILAENERLKESGQPSEESKEGQPLSEFETSKEIEQGELFPLVGVFEDEKLVLGREFYVAYRESKTRNDLRNSRDAFHELIKQGSAACDSDQIKAAHNLIGLLRLARKRGHARYENDRLSIDLVTAMNRLIPLGETTEIEGLVHHEIALVRSMRAKFLDETNYDDHDCTYEQIFDDLLLALRELVETRFKSDSLDNNAFKDAQDIAEQARNMVAILPNPDDQQEKMMKVEYKVKYLLNAMNTRILGTYPPELFESNSPFDEVEYPLDALAESE